MSPDTAKCALGGRTQVKNYSLSLMQCYMESHEGGLNFDNLMDNGTKVLRKGTSIPRFKHY